LVLAAAFHSAGRLGSVALRVVCCSNWLSTLPSMQTVDHNACARPPLRTTTALSRALGSPLTRTVFRSSTLAYCSRPLECRALHSSNTSQIFVTLMRCASSRTRAMPVISFAAADLCGHLERRLPRLDVGPISPAQHTGTALTCTCAVFFAIWALHTAWSLECCCPRMARGHQCHLLPCIPGRLHRQRRRLGGLALCARIVELMDDVLAQPPLHTSRGGTTMVDESREGRVDFWKASSGVPVCYYSSVR
jgi:hypothetical protein